MISDHVRRHELIDLLKSRGVVREVRRKPELLIRIGSEEHDIESEQAREHIKALLTQINGEVPDYGPEAEEILSILRGD